MPLDCAGSCSLFFYYFWIKSFLAVSNYLMEIVRFLWSTSFTFIIWIFAFYREIWLYIFEFLQKENTSEAGNFRNVYHPIDINLHFLKIYNI